MTGMLIAGSASGVGKTTVTLALIAAMRRRGRAVQPFKGGPDFLDTGHHTRLAERTARNLDTWMLTHEANRDVLGQGSIGADAVIVEGMMGLFDGKSGSSDTGSSAEIAKLLQLPVILVLDAGKSARSIAAVVLGFESFDTALPLAGVILNRVASERHYRMLEVAITQRCRTPILGWLPRAPAIAIPERHLGLRTAEEGLRTAEEGLRTAEEGLRTAEESPSGSEIQAEALADLAERYLDLDSILKLECGLDLAPGDVEDDKQPEVRIGVARDRAFSFYYEDNLDLLRQAGAEIVAFSPLHDLSLPPNLDGLYLGGGYPELYAAQLSANTTMLASIGQFAAEGNPLYAECGGMIYLSQSIDSSAMANILPLAFEMTPKLVQFGYVTVTLTEDCLLGKAGTELRGHSFHYSQRSRVPQAGGGSNVPHLELQTAYEVTYSLSGKQEPEGFTHGNILASYIHIHFRTHPDIARSMVAAARRQVPA